MHRLALCCAALIGCGSSTASAPPPPRSQVATASDQRADRVARERVRKDGLSAAHRELLDEQQTFLAATCEKTAGQEPQPRCEPSCYRPEPPDVRAGKKFGRAEIVHLACKSADSETAPIILADEIGGSNIAVRPIRGRLPRPHKKDTWEAEVEAAVGASLQPEVGRGDVIRVTGAWKSVEHPVTNERLRCVTVSHYVTSMRRALDPCGAQGAVACEAAGNAAVHGINVVHYRLAEARQLHTRGKDAECQRAALEAIAVARGLPRWRQYVTLNVNQWKAYSRYRTRFDGALDEEALFATATRLGNEAQVLHAECGGANHRTTAAQEQSFHTCW